MSAQLTAVHPVLMVRDIGRALSFYRRLGFTHTFVDDVDDPRYAGVQRDQVTLHLQWHEDKEWTYPVDRPVYRFVVSDVDALHGSFAVANITDMTTPMATPWGTYEFHLRDEDGNGLQFYCV